MLGDSVALFKVDYIYSILNQIPVTPVDITSLTWCERLVQDYQTYLCAERWTDRWLTTVSNDLRPTEDKQTSQSHSSNQSAGRAEHHMTSAKHTSQQTND